MKWKVHNAIIDIDKCQIPISIKNMFHVKCGIQIYKMSIFLPMGQKDGKKKKKLCCYAELRGDIILQLNDLCIFSDC